MTKLTAIFLTALLLSLKCLAQLSFENPYIFTPLKGTNATAGYAIVKNTSDQDVTLSVKAVPGFKKVETHETLEKDGRMSMKQVDNFTIKAKSSLVLEPGGRHIMLFDPKNTFKDGETVDVQFIVNGKSRTEKFKLVPRTTGHH